MKQIYIMIILLLCIACSEFKINVTPVASTTETAILSKEEACEIALSAITDFYPEKVTVKSDGSSPQISVSSVISIDQNFTKSGNHLSDPLMYAVNFDNNNGFALISTNRNTSSLLAITKNGYYDGISTGNQNLDLYIDELTYNLKNIETNSFIDVPIINDSYRTVTRRDTTSIPSMSTTVWHQWEPFNWYCSYPYNSDIPTGCGPIAIAQAMAIFQYPSSIELTYNHAGTDCINLSWSNMINHKNPHSDCIYCKQNASLLAEIYKQYDAYYNPTTGGSSTYLIDAPGCLEAFGYSSNFVSYYDLYSITQSLSNSYPVIIRGEQADGSGHAWLIDGYKYYFTETKTYRSVSGQIEELYSTEQIKEWYLSFNYGHNGTNNGYFICRKEISAEGENVVGGSVTSVPISIFDSRFHNIDNKLVTNIHPEI